MVPVPGPGARGAARRFAISLHRGPRSRPDRVLRPLAAPADLAEALSAAGRQYAHELPGAQDTEELRGLARRLYRVFAAVEEGDMDTACETANAVMRDTGAMPVLSRHGGEAWHLHFHAADARWAVGWGAAKQPGARIGRTTAGIGACGWPPVPESLSGPVAPSGPGRSGGRPGGRPGGGGEARPRRRV
ncbi:ABATE domain-containing protein [Nocardiopsis baichengensis]|uniref:ABATE domain-containing protein n=1 Tax=Nocardiopsis baichengensis TaxID=280240 RepID=UPI001EF9F363|nr:ABATE domain-containing protein [Nocardiopsis baichengensis]